MVVISPLPCALSSTTSSPTCARGTAVTPCARCRADSGWARQDLLQRGFALNVGDRHPDVMGVAVPVRASDGQILVFTGTVTALQTSCEQLLTDVGPRLTSLVQGVLAALPEQAAIINWSGDPIRQPRRLAGG